MPKTKVIDGDKIKESIQNDLTESFTGLDRTVRLDLLCAGGNKITETFMRLKKDFGESVGVQTVLHTFARGVTQNRFRNSLQTVVSSSAVDGVVIQLPLADRLPTQQLLNMVPTDKDVDMLSQDARKQFEQGTSQILPPVVGAVREICSRHKVELNEAKTAVVGSGRLVGGPVAVWLANNFTDPLVLTKGDDLSRLQAADVIISGAGDPHIIKPAHIKDGAVLVDAGTSSTQEGTKGDIDPACKKKASVFSPVPGGVGPITIAKLFQNLLTLTTDD